MNINLHLYKLIATHLADDSEAETMEEFVEWVTALFLVETLRGAPELLTNIPTKRFLEFQIRDLLRKKIYGHYSLDHFRQTKR
jgi:hypothetical protein